jgi:hypothetical protein
MNRARAFYQTHQEFILLLALFISFRLMAVVAYRPGGLVLDFSDFYFYRVFAELTRLGYYPYVNLWTAYPPIFPYLMIGLYKISALLPPWTFPNLWFTLLLGGTLLVFEAGNLVLIYTIARLFYPSRVALRCGWFYAGLFVPVYTLTGWFEGFPLFFFLLALYLLLRGRLLLSSLLTGVGFMIKLMPVLLIPIGLRLCITPDAQFTMHNTQGAEKNARALRIRRCALYIAVLAITVLAIALPFYLLNPRLILASLQMATSRAPWETVWALLEGEYGYGVIEADMRDLTHIGISPGLSRLPWGLISLAFAALYLWLYSRVRDWTRPRTAVAFAGLSMNLFMLYSKGYSPQFLVWLLPFLVLLLPNLRGAFYAILLSLANIIEANFYFIMFPSQHWLLAITVLLRTFLMLVSCGEYALLLFPTLETPSLHYIRRLLLAGLVVALLSASILGAPRLVADYFTTRLETSPYRETIETLCREATPGAGLILQDQTTYDWLYPYLRGQMTLYLIEDYAPPGETIEGRISARVERWAAGHQELWLVDPHPEATDLAEEAATTWLKGHAYELPPLDAGPARLTPYLTARAFTSLDPAPRLGEVAVLAGYNLREKTISPGRTLRLVLLWQALGPSARSYTVFTHLLDGQGRVIAGQDKPPQAGVSPTMEWQRGQHIADPYHIPIPADVPPAIYRLEVGMYDAATGKRLPISRAGDDSVPLGEITVH